MSKCPYTWVKGLFSSNKKQKNCGDLAQELRVRVQKKGEITVDVSLPAKSARWLIELIPYEVLEKIYAEGIPIDDMQEELASKKELFPKKIFSLQEDERSVQVWLE